MLNQSEESAGSSTQPRPELNPLLNPLLAENMKRWAEVYFSAAPGDRDQAVRALLEELREKRSNALLAEEAGSPLSEPHGTTSISSRPDTVSCIQCGQENPRSYQFCGNCGSELEKAVAKAAHDSAPWQRWEDPEYSEEGAAEPPDATGPAYAPPGYHGLSILQGGSEIDSDAPDFMYEAAPRHRSRIFLGLFFALVIGGLGYKAWKATQGTEKAYAPPPPPVSAADNGPSGTPEGATATEKTDTDAAAKSAKSEKAGSSIPPQKRAQEVESASPKAETASKAEDDTADAGQPITKRGNASAPAPPVPSTGAAANGSEELSVAQQYLSGRKNSQAASWLWKSVGKHNGQATLLLADLYLKGDGVSKNCDQARILLDSAARKGVAGAGERLRHLAAFGCQ